jgi:hypothetical protein
MFKKKTILFSICQLAVVHASLFGGAPDSHMHVISRADDVGGAYSVSGKARIQMREVRVETTGPSGKPVPHRLFLLFDPQSGIFSWHVAIEGQPSNLSEQTQWFNRNRAAFVKEGRLYTFTAETGPLALYVQESASRASSIDDAEEQALRSLGALNDPPGNVDVVKPWHAVRLSALSPDFVNTPGSAIFGPDPKVVDVEWDGKHWLVVLQARWKESVTLDAKFNLLSVRKVQ